MKIMVKNRQRKSTIGTFTEKKAMAPTNIMAEFKKIGIFPLDQGFSTYGPWLSIVGHSGFFSGPWSINQNESNIYNIYV